MLFQSLHSMLQLQRNGNTLNSSSALPKIHRADLWPPFWILSWMWILSHSHFSLSKCIFFSIGKKTYAWSVILTGYKGEKESVFNGHSRFMSSFPGETIPLRRLCVHIPRALHFRGGKKLCNGPCVRVLGCQNFTKLSKMRALSEFQPGKEVLFRGSSQSAQFSVYWQHKEG